MTKRLDILEGKSAFGRLIWATRNDKATEDMAIQAAEENPEATLAHLVKFRDQPWARKGILRAMDKSPVAALTFCRDYSDQFFYTEKLEKTTKRLAKESPRTALNFLHHTENETWAAEVRKMAEKVLSVKKALS